MLRSDPFRDLLVAELAMVLELAEAREVARALSEYWAEREQVEGRLGERLKQVAGLTRDDVEKIEEEVNRLVAAAGGSSKHAVLGRGGIDATLHSCLEEADDDLAREVSALGAFPRIQLRMLDRDRYRDFTPIGAGGMGLVFSAFDRELGREVAFKVLHGVGSGERAGSPFELTPPADGGRESQEFAERAARFLREVRVTSGLEHPGILPVHEVGETPEGVPYYTMRYVQGERTLADAIRAATSTEDRLAQLSSFLRVCDTIRYAHSRGVIHRDIKPANIALGEFGEVLVLDWGLARGAQDHFHSGHEGVLLQDPAPGLTSRRVALGTPGYMSPEAARGDDVDERGDIYGLGATLYEILTGLPPHGGLDLAELRIRLQSDVPPLATDRNPEVPVPLAEACARALSINPEERHPEAADLAAEVRAWQRQREVDFEVDALLAEAAAVRTGAIGLEGDPLLAGLDRVRAIAARILELRPADSRGEALVRECEEARERVFGQRERAGRRRLLVRVVVIGLLIAAVGGGAAAWQIDLKRQEAVESRDRSESLAWFILSDLHEPLSDLGRLDLLGPSARLVLEQFGSLDPEDATVDELRLQSQAHTRIATVLSKTGDLAAGLEAANLAIRGFERLLSPRPRHYGFLINLANTLRIRADLLTLSGDSEGGIADCRRVVEILEDLLEEYPEDAETRLSLAEACRSLGDRIVEVGKIEQSITLYQQAIELCEELLAEDGWNHHARSTLATTLSSLALQRFVRGEGESAATGFREAIRHYHEILAQEGNLYGIRDGLAHDLVKLGMVLQRYEDLEDGIASFREGIEEYRELVRRDPSNMDSRGALGYALRWQAGALIAGGYYDAAAECLDEAVGILEPLVQRETPNREWLESLAGCLSSRADLRYLAEDDLAGSVDSLEESLVVSRSLLAMSPGNLEAQSNIAGALASLGDRLARLGRIDEARNALQQSVERLEALLREVPDDVPDRYTLAWVQVTLGEYAEPPEDERMFRLALDNAEMIAADAPGNAVYQGFLATARFNLGLCLSDSGGDPEEARALLVSTVQFWDTTDPGGQPHVARENQRRLVISLICLGQHLSRMFAAAEDEAYRVSLASEALSAFERIFALDPDGQRWPPIVCDALASSTRLLGALGDTEEALQMGRRGIEVGRRYADLDPDYRPELMALVEMHLEHLLQAARSSAAAVAQAPGEQGAEGRRQAILHLSEYLDLCREERDRAAGDTGPFDERIESVRTGDPVLAPLRADADFRALFGD